MKHWTNARPNGIYSVENLIIVKVSAAKKKKKNDPQNNQRILY